MADEVFRFRSIKALLEWKELERQQIYLAAPEELNDPMEGYKDVVWRGDVVLWENLVRHYLLSLLVSALNFQLMTDETFEEPTVSASLTEDDLPTDAFRGIYREICEEFLKGSDVASLGETLAGLERPPRREGVRFVLSLVHPFALSIVFSTMGKHGLIKESPAAALAAPLPIGQLIKQYSKGAAAPEVEFETLAFAANHTREIQTLRHLLNPKDGGTKVGARKAHYLIFSFPDRYVEGVVEGILHPPWYTACFSGTCTNASNWATYGDQHRGVALMYRPTVVNNERFIPLSGAVGIKSLSKGESEPVRGSIRGTLHSVAYENTAPEIPFFQSLGNLAKKKLSRAWHTDRNGQRSPLVDEIFNEEAEWREKYWAAFQRVTTTKLTDWRHEEEYRIVISDFLGVYRENRLVEYEFSSLVGIVFGMRTAEKHKIEVIRLATALCEKAGRTDFGFFQMTYDAAQGCLIRL